MKKVNGNCDVGVGFDDTFKANNSILFMVTRANGMIVWRVRHFYFKGGKCCLKNA